MRKVSLKRQKLNRAVEPWRKALRERVGRCEHCLRHHAPEYLDVDEISRGCTRALSLTAEYAVLVVCRPCHGAIQSWPRERRLALLYLARTSDYDLAAYHKLIGRVKPDQEEVDRAMSWITEYRSNS